MLPCSWLGTGCLLEGDNSRHRGCAKLAGFHAISRANRGGKPALRDLGKDSCRRMQRARESMRLRDPSEGYERASSGMHSDDHPLHPRIRVKNRPPAEILDQTANLSSKNLLQGRKQERRVIEGEREGRRKNQQKQIIRTIYQRRAGDANSVSQAHANDAMAADQKEPKRRFQRFTEPAERKGIGGKGPPLNFALS